MILHICYNQSSEKFLKEVKKLINDKYPLVDIKSYDEEHFKERKQSFRVKGGYSARMTPFALLTDDNNVYVRAFYSENKGCTTEKLDEFLQSIALYGDEKIEVNNESTNYQYIKQ